MLLPLAALLVALISPSSTALAVPPPPAQPMPWALWPAPAIPGYPSLSGIAAISSNDVWAVGDTENGGPLATLTEHWNGSVWSIVPTPNAGTADSLNDVAAVSSSDVWAVGSTDTGTLIEQWNGTVWNVIPSPGGVTNGSPDTLSGVAVVSASDIWAVGVQDASQAPLIEQWNGTSWNEIPSPTSSTDTYWLSSVAAVSASDVWVVGQAISNATGYPQTLIEQWNGNAWSVVPSPGLSGCCGFLTDVAAVSANDVWAVGGTGADTLVEQWNGSAWNVVPSPNVGTLGDGLSGVDAVSANDVWAVGDSVADICRGPCGYNTLIEHWNGTAWSVSPSPDYCVSGAPDSCAEDVLQAVAASSAGNVWAVGSNEFLAGSLILRHGYALDTFGRNRTRLHLR